MDNTLPVLTQKYGVLQKDIKQLNIYPGAVKRRNMQDKPITFGLAADRPTNGDDVSIYVWFSTDTNVLSIWNSTAWKSVTLT